MVFQLDQTMADDRGLIALTNFDKNFRVLPSKKFQAPKTTQFWMFFDNLMVNIFRTKHNTVNQKMALETTKGPHNVLKFHELWSTNG